jgi:hypothetical protein
MTNNLSPNDVESFIGTLETSYTYDPSPRWRHAYDQLRALRLRFQAARARYAWLSLTSLLILLVAAAVLLSGAVSPFETWPQYASMGLLFIPIVFDSFARLLARRREPLLRYESQIDNACGKFDRVIAESKNAPA